MKSKYKYLVAVTAFVLLAGCFAVMAQDQPAVPTKDQEIGSLEQEVTELQNRIRALKSDSAQQLVNENILAPRPEYDSGSRPQAIAPVPNSVYPMTPSPQSTSPAPSAAPQVGPAPQVGYDPVPPVQPWGIEQPPYVVHQQVEHFVPVQVPVYVEPLPCVYYEPVCNHFIPPAIGLEFFFGGNGNHYKHKKHKH